MTVTYYDTSFLLSVLLNQHPEIDYDTVWHGDGVKVSSYLLTIETLVSIRRVSALHSQLGEIWMEKKLKTVRHFLDAITIKHIDHSIEEIIETNSSLSKCRTLDAIHLSTALYFQAHSSERVELCTLDMRMRSVASDLGFTVVPELAP